MPPPRSIVRLGREICSSLVESTHREWLITNGRGSYGSGTVANLLTRGYHGLLVAALNPPLGRTLMLVKVDDTLRLRGTNYNLFANRWVGGSVDPQGFQHLEAFWVEGSVPVWRYTCAEALLEKRIWMEQGEDTTFVQYTLLEAADAARLSLKAIVDYRDHHSRTQGNWQMDVGRDGSQVRVLGYSGAAPLFLSMAGGAVTIANNWLYGFELAEETNRGLRDREDHVHAATFEVEIAVGTSVTFVGSTLQKSAAVDGAIGRRRIHEIQLLEQWRKVRSDADQAPDWIEQLVLSADQFIVDRRAGGKIGKTVIAGYHWFGDWGRDTMISLPGLTLETGRPCIARSILLTFAEHTDQGMLPNRFTDRGRQPEYNSVDATLWYFQALRSYYETTKDQQILRDLFGVLKDIIDWHLRGTRYHIHRDERDGLLYAGQTGVQLTWMDAKAGDWVVTPRIGKPVEVNALWYNALRAMAKFARQLGEPPGQYDSLAESAAEGFGRFWNKQTGYCFDVLDGPDGNEDALRPNQIFAVSLPERLLSDEQRRAVVEVCGKSLLTSFGLRSLAPTDPAYQGYYSGNQRSRDGAYHQGSAWGWLLGPYLRAYLHISGNSSSAMQRLEPFADHLQNSGLGMISEIFDGNPPMSPRGCISQAWSCAEALRAWSNVQKV